MLLFNDYRSFNPPPKCYLTSKGIEHLAPFLPLLKEVVESAQFLLAVIAFLNLFEVNPGAAHLVVTAAAGHSWLAAHPEDKGFWIDHGIGRRLCSLIQATLSPGPKLSGLDPSLKKDIEILLSSLVRIGVPEASWLEASLN